MAPRNCVRHFRLYSLSLYTHFRGTTPSTVTVALYVQECNMYVPTVRERTATSGLDRGAIDVDRAQMAPQLKKVSPTRMIPFCIANMSMK